MRQWDIGVELVDQFPVYELDGYTKHSGLGPSDFTVTVYKDGVIVGTPTPVIAEIGVTGEYSLTVTFPTAGYWLIEVLILYNYDIYGLEVEVSAGGTISDKVDHIITQVDKIDIAPTLGPAAVTTGSLMDRTMNRDASKTYNQATDSLEAVRDRLG